jgi:hypothetical protein
MGIQGRSFWWCDGGICPIVPFLLSLLSFLLYYPYSTLNNRRVFQRFHSKSFLRVKALTCQPMYHSLSFACLKNHETDECSIENLPWDSGKGRCLWRRGKTCPAQVVHALSNETGMPTREGGKPLPLEAWGDVTCHRFINAGGIIFRASYS